MNIAGVVGVQQNVSRLKKRHAVNSTTKNNSAFDINSLKPNNLSTILSFSGNTTKNVSQVASIAPEYQGILNSVYKKGGLGNVAGEAAVAFSKHGNLDIRTFVPYYSGDNHDGKVRVLSIIDSDIEGVQKRIAANETPAQLKGSVIIKSVDPGYELKNGETFIIQQTLDDKIPLIKQYAEIEPTSLSGTIKTINSDLATQTYSPYHVFKIKGTGVGIDGKPPTYIVHTPEVAKFGSSYNSTGAYANKMYADALYTRFTRATIDAIPKMDTEEFGFYNPGNYWLHDRQAFPALVEISEKSAAGDTYWRGIKAHSTFHNIGRGYQGHYSTPIDFMQIIGSENDIKELEKNPADYDFVKKMAKKMHDERHSSNGKYSPEEIFTKEEMKRMNAIFKPLYGAFLDETGEYNMCEIPIASARKNSYNCSLGTVSRHYAREMKNPNTQEVSEGIAKHLASVPTVDIVNGSSAVNLGLDKVGKWGNGTGFPEELTKGFTPFSPEAMKDTEKFFTLKQDNKKWLINSLHKIMAQGEESAKSVIFGKSDIQNGAKILGNLSEYKDGDILFIGWGRPDTQKGFPTTFEGILDFLKDGSVEQEAKDHAKFLIGAGPWKDGVGDWETIKSQMAEISQLQNGRYKDNVCYLDGFFTNRIVACADYSLITSRFEPCGITPLESFAGGAPVISNNTGGSPNFIKAFFNGDLQQAKAVSSENGFLTRHAFLSNPETLGLKGNFDAKQLDEARIKVVGGEVGECIKQAVYLFRKNIENYKKMAMNALGEKIDWHENLSYNAGMSAIDCYKQNAWGITSANKELSGFERSAAPLANLKGTIEKVSSAKSLGFLGIGAVGSIAAVGIIAKLISLHNKKVISSASNLNKGDSFTRTK